MRFNRHLAQESCRRNFVSRGAQLVRSGPRVRWKTRLIGKPVTGMRRTEDPAAMAWKAFP